VNAEGNGLAQPDALCDLARCDAAMQARCSHAREQLRDPFVNPGGLKGSAATLHAFNVDLTALDAGSHTAA